jgi:hypothetical protein
VHVSLPRQQGLQINVCEVLAGSLTIHFKLLVILG